MLNWRERRKTRQELAQAAVIDTAIPEKPEDTTLRLIVPKKVDPLDDEQLKLYLNTTTSAGSVTVGATSTFVLGINPKRRFSTIVNDSSNVVYLSLGPVAVSGKGIRLNANGGSIILGLDTDIPYTGQVFGIASGSSNVTVTES